MDFLSVVSDELKTTSEDNQIKIVLQILPARLWGKIDEVARIRIENKLIRSLQAGKTTNPKNDKSNIGWLVTWGRSFLPYFTLKHELFLAIAEKLEGDEKDQNYIALYFMSYLPKTLNTASDLWREMESKRYINAIVKGVSDPFGSDTLREYLLLCFGSYPSDWRDMIKEKLKPLENDNPDYYKKLIELPEEIEFPEEDDIPF